MRSTPAQTAVLLRLWEHRRSRPVRLLPCPNRHPVAWQTATNTRPDRFLTGGRLGPDRTRGWRRRRLSPKSVKHAILSCVLLLPSHLDVHGVGFQRAASACFRRLVLVMYGCDRYMGSSTVIVTTR